MTSLSSAAVAVALAAPAAAQVSLESTFIKDDSPTIDGLFDEWIDEEGGEIAPFILLGEQELVGGEGEWGDEEDLSAEVAFVHNPKALFAALKIKDQRLIRTKRLTSVEDHVELWIGLPGEKRKTVGIGIYAGQSRQSKTVEIRKMKRGKKMAGGKIKGAEGAVVVDDSGYHVEVSIPWSAIPGGADRASELNAGLYVVDCDMAAKMSEKSILGTAPIEGRGSSSFLPAVSLSELASGLDPFYERTGLSPSVKSSFAGSADVTGDSKKEQVVVMDRYLLVLGTGIGDDGGYAYCDLPVESGDQVTKFELKELTGDGKLEIVLNFRNDDPINSRRWMAVFQVGENGNLKEAFSAITLLSTNIFKIENGYRFKKVKGKKTAIEIYFKAADGVDKDLFQDGVPDLEGTPMVLPWSKPSKAVYLFSDKGFVQK